MLHLALAFALAQVTASPLPLLVTPAPSPPPTALPSPSPAPGTLQASPLQANLYPSGLQKPPVVIAITNASGEIAATLDAQIATVQIDQLAHTVALQGTLATGRATLHITDAGGASVDIPVRNAYDAGTIVPSTTLKLTGDPLDPVWLQTQIAATMARATPAQPGLKPQFGTYALPPSLPPGAIAAVAVPVQLLGGDQYYDVNGTTNVSIQNVAVASFSPPALFYDDDPEKIEAAGVLYRGSVTASRPTRLYYYHENGEDPRDLLLVLSSDSQDPTSVQLIDSTAGPNADVLSVGHAVTKNFLLTKPQNEGVILDLPQGQPYVVHDLKMQRLDGVSGNVDLRILSGGNVTVTVLAVPPAANGATPAPGQIVSYLSQPQLPGDGHHRTGVFALTGEYATNTLAYSVGGADAFVRYGATTPQNLPASPAGHDYGDYGVLRSLVFDANNPSGQAATLYLYETPQGGVLRGSFLVDGTLHEVGCTRVPNRYMIAQLPTLGPGERRTTTVLTMTDGGSNYPIEVGITATPPQSAAPPITAPDGCFPARF
ncbi:MAG TPA: hypothetical protein VIG51_10265 [Candidatus Baltobacteraceae bacterium]|jgi:hypothetical protein